MLASLYPILESGPHTTGNFAWPALVIIGALLAAIVVFAWASLRSAPRHQQTELPVEQPTAKAA
ncbi:MAG: hypothetical protein U0V56_10350 [Actinomycetota bacterium]